MSGPDKLGLLGPDNFREFARRAIDSYAKKGMHVDAMLWGAIIAHYNQALDAALEGSAENVAERRAIIKQREDRALGRRR